MEKNIRLKGLDFHFTDSGEGDRTIVLMHGSYGYGMGKCVYCFKNQ